MPRPIVENTVRLNEGEFCVIFDREHVAREVARHGRHVTDEFRAADSRPEPIVEVVIVRGATCVTRADGTKVCW
ncbi:MAG TPA: hypothetical protein VNM66_02400 [Thermodesulfobacteriota bacterium]|nr:hypothetical protein [Thermodesulfobacteriota bacterium]